MRYKIPFILFLVAGCLLLSPTIDDTKINWVTMEDATKLAKKKKKKIFIDVYTTWCGWCKRMDQTTFRHPEIIKYMNKHYIAIKFNAEAKRDISFNGEDYSFVNSGRRGYHQLAAKLLNGRLSYPSFVVLDEQLNFIQAIPGYQQPKSLDKILKYFGENYYTSKTWQAFSSEYQSTIQ